jgi:hypothetical protein
MYTWAYNYLRTAARSLVIRWYGESSDYRKWPFILGVILGSILVISAVCASVSATRDTLRRENTAVAELSRIAAAVERIAAKLED